MEAYELEWSFRDRMQEARDIAATKHACRFPPVRVARVRWLSVDELAARWSVSTTRIKLLCAAKRVHARRSRTGKGRRWQIAGVWNGREYEVTVIPGKRGPVLTFQPNDKVPF